MDPVGALVGKQRSVSVTKSKPVKTPDAVDPLIGLDPDIIAVMRLGADLQRASSRHMKSLWREKGLTERGLFILALVNAGLDRPSRLIEYFDVLPSTITFETEKLVTAGLLVRESLPTDRRVVQLSLTEQGKAVYREMADTLNGFLRPRLRQLAPGELASFLATFSKIVEPFPQRGEDVADPDAVEPAPAPARAKARRAS
jgi:DNA-binding MarR family transcriptional regulator